MLEVGAGDAVFQRAAVVPESGQAGEAGRTGRRVGAGAGVRGGVHEVHGPAMVAAGGRGWRGVAQAKQDACQGVPEDGPALNASNEAAGLAPRGARAYGSSRDRHRRFHALPPAQPPTHQRHSMPKSEKEQEQDEVAEHSVQPKRSHISGTGLLGLVLTGYEAWEAMPHRPLPGPGPIWRRKKPCRGGG